MAFENERGTGEKVGRISPRFDIKTTRKIMTADLRRNKFIGLLLILVFLFLSGCQSGKYEPQTGDIVFQDSGGLSSREIKIATDSPYSHCGIVSVEGNEEYVIEAVGPVRKTPLDDWIARGGGMYTAKRLTGKFNSGNVIKMAEKYLGLPYDKYYEWDDDKLYCSELVYKAFLLGDNIRLCPPRKFEDYNINGIKETILTRYGTIPEGLKIVAPADIAESKMLKTVYSDFSELDQ